MFQNIWKTVNSIYTIKNIGKDIKTLLVKNKIEFWWHKVTEYNCLAIVFGSAIKLIKNLGKIFEVLVLQPNILIL